MNDRARPIVLALLSSTALAACAGKPAATGPARPTAAPIPIGIHGCHFVADGTAYGEHRCDVGPGSLDKLSGMETFRGTIVATGDGVRLDATLDCGDMATACGKTFTATLRREGEVWRGQVVAAPDASDWFLAGATFELVDAAGYGGDAYGGAE